MSFDFETAETQGGEKAGSDILAGLALGYEATGDETNAEEYFKQLKVISSSFNSVDSIQKLGWAKTEKDALETIFLRVLKKENPDPR